MVSCPAFGVAFVHRFAHLLVWNRAAKIVIRAVAGDGSEPGAEPGNISQGMKLPQRRKKNFLDQVVHLARRNAGKEDAVDHARITVIEAAKGSAIAVASGANEGSVLARFGDRPDSHSLTLHASSAKVNDVSHGQAIRAGSFMQVQDGRKERGVNTRALLLRGDLAA